MSPIGVIEIYYGRTWSPEARREWIARMSELGLSFHLYGPKSESCLRQEWRRPPTAEELTHYRELRRQCREHHVGFGLVLSPVDLHEDFDGEARRALIEKVKILSDLEPDFFGVFFDDMPSADDLAERQLEIVSAIKPVVHGKMIFCPTFYSLDPLLTMLFGECPAGYLEVLGRELHGDIEILWTGEQIISPEITIPDLEEVKRLLARRPFICDNYFADDGPMHSNFLKPVPLSGRERGVFEYASHWAFNPMNQIELSRLAFLGVSGFLRGGRAEKEAFEAAVVASCSPELAKFILQNGRAFASEGLEALDEKQRADLISQLNLVRGDPAAREIVDWLTGKYAFDLESLLGND